MPRQGIEFPISPRFEKVAQRYQMEHAIVIDDIIVPYNGHRVIGVAAAEYRIEDIIRPEDFEWGLICVDASNSNCYNRLQRTLRLLFWTYMRMLSLESSIAVCCPFFEPVLHEIRAFPGVTEVYVAYRDERNMAPRVNVERVGRWATKKVKATLNNGSYEGYDMLFFDLR